MSNSRNVQTPESVVGASTLQAETNEVTATATVVVDDALTAIPTPTASEPAVSTSTAPLSGPAVAIIAASSALPTAEISAPNTGASGLGVPSAEAIAFAVHIATGTMLRRELQDLQVVAYALRVRVAQEGAPITQSIQTLVESMRALIAYFQDILQQMPQLNQDPLFQIICTAIQAIVPHFYLAKTAREQALQAANHAVSSAVAIIDHHWREIAHLLSPPVGGEPLAPLVAAQRASEMGKQAVPKARALLGAAQQVYQAMHCPTVQLPSPLLQFQYAQHPVAAAYCDAELAADAMQRLLNQLQNAAEMMHKYLVQMTQAPATSAVQPTAALQQPSVGSSVSVPYASVAHLGLLGQNPSSASAASASAPLSLVDRLAGGSGEQAEPLAKRPNHGPA